MTSYVLPRSGSPFQAGNAGIYMHTPRNGARRRRQILTPFDETGNSSLSSNDAGFKAVGHVPPLHG